MLIHSLGTTSNIVNKCVCQQPLQMIQSESCQCQKTPMSVSSSVKVLSSFQSTSFRFQGLKEDDTFIHHNHHHANMCKYNEPALAKPIILVLLIHTHIYMSPKT